jgi:hypothetical protein
LAADKHLAVAEEDNHHNLVVAALLVVDFVHLVAAGIGHTGHPVAGGTGHPVAGGTGHLAAVDTVLAPHEVAQTGLKRIKSSSHITPESV